jgi:ubiquitin-activating enzyme E1
LWAEVWGLPRHKKLDEIKKIVDSVKIPPFKPKQGKKIETDEKAKKQEDQPQEQDIDSLLKELYVYFSSTKEKLALKPLDFEKDDDTNFHIDFIGAAANLRARMYAIPEVERLKVKAIAGRIMPAIATTTGAVSGLVSSSLPRILLV